MACAAAPKRSPISSRSSACSSQICGDPWRRESFEKACEAYEGKRILVLVGERQMGSLEQVVELARGTEVTFLRLVMLVGG